jgi:hypothetical protein
MAKNNAERSEKAVAKRKSRGEVEIRFHSLQLRDKPLLN